MSFTYEDRLADSSYIEGVARVRIEQDANVLCRADGRWELIVKLENGKTSLLVAGPMTRASMVTNSAGSEFIIAKLKLGVYIPHFTPRRLLDIEQTLPESIGQSFWLGGSVWQLPDYENFDTFVARLVHDEVLVRDPVVDAALQGHPLDVASRTVQHRFLHVTGLTQTYIRQIERAWKAATLLERGASILDTVYEAGYFDQPHLTRSLKHFIGQTPAQIARISLPD